MATQTLTNAITTNPVTGANIYTSGLAPDSSLNSVYNTGTNAGGSTDKSLTNNYSVSGSTPDTGNAIASNLNAGFAPTQNTIMQNYEAANQALSNQAATTAKSLTDTGQYNLGYENTQNKNLLTQQQESQRGAAVNPGAIVSLQVQADKRVRDLTTQMNDALANNNSQLASSLAQNVAAEQNAITNARTVFLSQYFQAQTEARAQATFKTPEQTQVLAMAAQYPDAGILPTDDLATAQKKISGSTLYTTGVAATKAQTGLAGAQAGLAGVQAQQVGIINKFLGGDTAQFKPDEDGLLNNSVTDATLHAKYDSFPGGVGAAIIAGIESRAQARGWNPQTSALITAGNLENVRNLFSGGYTGASTALTNWLGGFASKAGLSVPSPANLPASAPSVLSTLISPTVGQTTVLAGKTYKFNGSAWIPQ